MNDHPTHLSGHPSDEELAEAAEGLLGPDRTAEVEQHVTGCVDCQRASAALRSVSTALAATPSPRMPSDVARRLEAVVAQESARRQADAGRAQAARPGATRHQHQGRRTPVTLGPFGADRPRRPRGRRWLPVLAAACLAALAGLGGYVLSATAGLNEPPVVAAAVDSRDLAVQARRLEQTQDLDPHRFSNAWFCARSVTRGRITGLAGARVDGSPALLVYTRSDDVDRVTVVTGCGAVQPSAIASAPLPR